MSDPLQTDKEKICKQVFERLDKNGDGFNTASELHEALQETGRPSLTDQELAKKVDTDGDGKINFAGT